MKSLITSVILLSLVISITVGGSICTSTQLSKLQHNIELIDTNKNFESIKESVSNIEKSYEKSKYVFSFILDDDSSEKISLYISDIKSSAEAESYSGILTAKSRLIAHIKQIRQLSSINIDSIF